MKQGKDLGRKIRKMRNLQNIPQRYMAKELGMTQGAYSNFEKKEEGISEERLKKIAEIMGVSVEDIESIEDRITVNINTQNNTKGTNEFVNHNANSEKLLKQITENLAQTTKALSTLATLLSQKK